MEVFMKKMSILFLGFMVATSTVQPMSRLANFATKIKTKAQWFNKPITAKSIVWSKRLSYAILAAPVIEIICDQITEPKKLKEMKANNAVHPNFAKVIQQETVSSLGEERASKISVISALGTGLYLSAFNSFAGEDFIYVEKCPCKKVDCEYNVAIEKGIISSSVEARIKKQKGIMKHECAHLLYKDSSKLVIFGLSTSGMSYLLLRSIIKKAINTRKNVHGLFFMPLAIVLNRLKIPAESAMRRYCEQRADNHIGNDQDSCELMKNFLNEQSQDDLQILEEVPLKDLKKISPFVYPILAIYCNDQGFFDWYNSPRIMRELLAYQFDPHHPSVETRIEKLEPRIPKTEVQKQ